MTAERRWHGLDALRAAMMLLGVLLHVACSYQLGTAEDGWPYRDPQQSLGATVLVLSVHLFRMPLFFVLGGFFGALLMAKRGPRVFAHQRLYRLGVPLGVGVLTVVPLLGLAFTYAHGVHAAWKPWPDGSLAHLWFLWYLLLVSAAAVVLHTLHRRKPLSWFTRWVDPRRTWLLVVLTWLLLLSMQAPSINTPNRWWPQWPTLALYGYCYAVGWQVYAQPAVLEAWQARAMRRTLAGLVSAAVAVIASLAWYHTSKTGSPSAVAFVLAQAGTAGTIWLLGSGLIGWCNRWLNRPHATVRWFVDASYWIYWIHLPVVVGFTALLRTAELGLWTKVVIVFPASLAVCACLWFALRAMSPQRR